MNIVPCTSVDQAGWLMLRSALWPHCDPETQRAEMKQQLDAPHRFHAVLAGTGDEPIGLAEASIRSDHVNGTRTSPVLFLEGLYVVPHARRRGVARALVGSLQSWGRAAGCSEFASDAALANLASHAVHQALGFDETERVVTFRKALD